MFLGFLESPLFLSFAHASMILIISFALDCTSACAARDSFCSRSCLCDTFVGGSPTVAGAEQRMGFSALPSCLLFNYLCLSVYFFTEQNTLSEKGISPKAIGKLTHYCLLLTVPAWSCLWCTLTIIYKVTRRWILAAWLQRGQCHCSSRGKIKSPKSVGWILWEPWTPVQNVMAIHQQVTDKW